MGAPVVHFWSFGTYVDGVLRFRPMATMRILLVIPVCVTTLVAGAIRVLDVLGDLLDLVARRGQ